MTFTPQLRLVAIAGAGAVAMLLLGAFLLLQVPHSARPVAKTIAPLHAAVHRNAATVAPVRPAAARPVPDPLLPASVSAALARHPVVVVSLFAPRDAVGVEARAEANTGASLTAAGFVAVDVTDEAEVRPLLAHFGASNDPSVLVFVRGGRVAARLDGFVDREVVAQAVAEARR